MDNASCHGKVRGSCGDAIEIFLTDGCMSSAACASACCGLASGKSLEEAASIDEAAILAELDLIPLGEEHCAHVASKALEAAIHHWMKNQL
jgi:nitrogen fixation NifU-like protein